MFECVTMVLVVVVFGEPVDEPLDSFFYVLTSVLNLTPFLPSCVRLAPESPYFF